MINATAKEVNQLCKATFNSDAGKRYLEILKAKFVDKVIYQPHMEHHEVAFIEGQRSIVMLILKEIETNIGENDGK